MVDISIIIVSYNTRELTLACIRSIYEQTTGVTFEVIVVDNASSDNSAEAIALNYPNINIISSSENLGFAKANNMAAIGANGRYLLLLNPDTVVLDGAIQRLFSFAVKHTRNRIYGGRTLYGDLTLNPTSCWKSPSLWSLFCYAVGMVSLFRRIPLFDPESYGSWQRDSEREVDIVTGCFLMIEKELWDRLSGFDPLFFMYGEDADLCIRAVKLGAIPIVTPEATIIHYCGASEKVRADKMVRLFRAKSQLFRRHWHPITAQVGIKLLMLSVLVRMFGFKLAVTLGFDDKEHSFSCWKDIWKERGAWVA